MSDTVVRMCSEYGIDLSSRQVAGELRDRIERGPGTFLLDFHGVYTVSHSFADELFAVLATGQGEDWFRRKIQICNIGPSARVSILDAIQGRMKTPEKS